MSGKVKTTKFSVLLRQHHLSWQCHNCLGNFVWQQNSSYAGRSFVTCYYSFKFPLNSHSLHSPAICSSKFWPQKELFWLVCVLHNNGNPTLVLQQWNRIKPWGQQTALLSFLVDTRSTQGGKNWNKPPYSYRQVFKHETHSIDCVYWIDTIDMIFYCVY